MSRCDAKGCRAPVDRGKLMCRRHWAMVPPHLQADVWSTWRACRPSISREYMAAVQAARKAVAEKEVAARA